MKFSQKFSIKEDILCEAINI